MIPDTTNIIKASAFDNKLWKNVSTSIKIVSTSIKINIIYPALLHSYYTLCDISDSYNSFHYFLFVQKHIYAIIVLFLVIVVMRNYLLWGTIDRMQKDIQKLQNIVQDQDEQIYDLIEFYEQKKKNHENINSLRDYIKRKGYNPDLISQEWYIEETIRADGRIDKSYYPCVGGKQLRSRKEVLKYLGIEDNTISEISSSN